MQRRSSYFTGTRGRSSAESSSTSKKPSDTAASTSRRRSFPTMTDRIVAALGGLSSGPCLQDLDRVPVGDEALERIPSPARARAVVDAEHVLPQLAAFREEMDSERRMELDQTLEHFPQRPCFEDAHARASDDVGEHRRQHDGYGRHSRTLD